MKNVFPSILIIFLIILSCNTKSDDEIIDVFTINNEIFIPTKVSLLKENYGLEIVLADAHRCIEICVHDTISGTYAFLSDANEEEVLEKFGDMTARLDYYIDNVMLGDATHSFVEVGTLKIEILANGSIKGNFSSTVTDEGEIILQINNGNFMIDKSDIEDNTYKHVYDDDDDSKYDVVFRPTAKSFELFAQNNMADFTNIKIIDTPETQFFGIFPEMEHHKYIFFKINDNKTEVTFAGMNNTTIVVGMESATDVQIIFEENFDENIASTQVKIEDGEHYLVIKSGHSDYTKNTKVKIHLGSADSVNGMSQQAIEASVARLLDHNVSTRTED